MNVTHSPDDLARILAQECCKILPSSFEASASEVIRSRRFKHHLIYLSCSGNDKKVSPEGKPCNYVAFVTQCESKILVEAVHNEHLPQKCIDELHCQQYLNFI